MILPDIFGKFSAYSITFCIILGDMILLLYDVLWHGVFFFKDRGNDNWLVRYEKQDDGLNLSDKVRK